MLGAIAGDIIGSAYEAHPIKYEGFPLFGRQSRFTDDTVLTIATAYSILEKVDYAESFKAFGRRYPNAGYGASFYHWIFSSQSGPYNSWGNGSAMRVSPLGFAFESIDAVLEEAERSASVTHNHPEGIRGAQATALAVFLARKGENKDSIKTEIEKRFAYDLKRTLDDIRPEYRFDVSCQGSVPESIIAFLESKDFEDALRKAVSLGGDSDTMACIAGGIAHAFYRKIPEDIVANVRERLPVEFLKIIDRFMEMYGL
jgi:ADP-ribosyl-[dinitrogen reductase] hydrolase